jgi:hypothetical protein
MNFRNSKHDRGQLIPARSNENESSILVDQLRRLGDLRDQGLLSSEQFYARRAQLLSRPA